LTHCEVQLYNASHHETKADQMMAAMLAAPSAPPINLLVFARNTNTSPDPRAGQFTNAPDGAHA
jgi:hypothetical protein